MKASLGSLLTMAVMAFALGVFLIWLDHGRGGDGVSPDVSAKGGDVMIQTVAQEQSLFPDEPGSGAALFDVPDETVSADLGSCSSRRGG